MKNKISCKIIKVLVIIWFLGASINPAYAKDLKQNIIENQDFSSNILYVGGIGPGNYTKIQDAVNDASYGDTVFVYDDSSPYYENVKITKKIDLIGENKDTTIINGMKTKYVVLINANKVKLDGFNIQNGSKEYSTDFGYEVRYGAVVVFRANQCIISNNVIENNDGYGILFVDSNYDFVSDNLIQNNKIPGIRLLYRCDGVQIFRNTFKNNPYGILPTYEHYFLKIVNNNFIDNSEYGIFLEGLKYSKVEENNFIGNEVHASFKYQNSVVSIFEIISNIISGIIASLSLKFDNNYWGGVTSRPYIIKGFFDFRYYSYPGYEDKYIYEWQRYDRNPVQEPHDI